MTAPRIWLFGDYNQAESRVVAWKGPVEKLKQWYKEGRDVHAETTRLVARVIQESGIKMPNDWFTHQSWELYVDKKSCGEAREQTKRVAHGYNYEIGVKRVALTLQSTEEVAATLMRIYDTLMPDIKLRYHAGIAEQVKRTRTIWTPDPVRFRKVFWDIIDGDTLRAAYAAYPQSTVGGMLNRTIALATRIFLDDEREALREQWCAWYGKENWDVWRTLRDRKIRSPQAIQWSGMDVRLNVHDAGGLSVPDDADLVRWAASTWKAIAEEPIMVDPKEPMIIPMEFKKGPTWGDLTDYKL